jgi:hypothetical protein
MAFVESGEILESYPNARGREVVFEIFAKYPLTPAAANFVEEAGKILEEAGFELRFKAGGQGQTNQGNTPSYDTQ